jgi:hypothetical protein
MYLNQATGKLYVFTTRLTDNTGGILCVETTSEAADPFCGFIALTGKEEAPPTTSRGISGMSNPMLIGSHLYSFNFAAGEQEGTKNKLTCFDVGAGEPCAGQPYPVTIPGGTVETNGNEPVGETATISGKAIIPIEIEGASYLACFDDASQKTCGGQWPVKLSFPYVSSFGAPFPLLTASGSAIGLCLPTGEDQCFNLEGESVATPAGMTEAIPATEEWNGPGLVLGPRVYLPNGNSESVDCYDYSTGKSCANFPKHLENLGLLYTVNPDPQRPTCIWVNSDDGSAQIQNFDAYTGEACGEGVIRALASQFVVPHPQCTPLSYVSFQVLGPARETYTSGSIAFDDGDGNPIPGLEERQLDATGTVSLAGLSLNTATGLPQFLITLNGAVGKVGAVEVRLTWTANYNATCVGPQTTVIKPAATPAPAPPAPAPTPTPTPKAGVLGVGSAHLAANNARACVASSGYLASVGGSLIASVTYRLDGHKLKTITKPNSHGAFALRVHVPRGRHHLSIHVAFTSASSVHSTTITKTLAHCAAAKKRVVTPRFTG